MVLRQHGLLNFIRSGNFFVAVVILVHKLVSHKWGDEKPKTSGKDLSKN